MPDHNTGNSMPYSLRIVCGFFNIPQLFKGYETGPPGYSPYPTRLESLTICWCNYKSSTFYWIILRPWVMVRPESNSRLPASQPDAQLTEPPVREVVSPLALWLFAAKSTKYFGEKKKNKNKNKNRKFQPRRAPWFASHWLWACKLLDCGQRFTEFTVSMTLVG